MIERSDKTDDFLARVGFMTACMESKDIRKYLTDLGLPEKRQQDLAKILDEIYLLTCKEDESENI